METLQEMLNVANTPEVSLSLIYTYYAHSVDTLNLCIQNIGTSFAHNLEFYGEKCQRRGIYLLK